MKQFNCKKCNMFLGGMIKGLIPKNTVMLCQDCYDAIQETRNKDYLIAKGWDYSPFCGGKFKKPSSWVTLDEAIKIQKLEDANNALLLY